MHHTRRDFLCQVAGVSLGFGGLRRMLLADDSRGIAASPRRPLRHGPLVPDPRGILDLPAGFRYDIISRVGQRMDDGLLVPGDPDGMATFAGPDGKTILIRNHELEPDQLDVGPFGPRNELIHRLDAELFYDRANGVSPCIGGTTTLLYDTRSRRLERQYLSLAGTVNNCSGGPTPWNTWITCEETELQAGAPFEKDHGYPFEVPAVLSGSPVRPQPIHAMGRFRREAVAVDVRSGVIFQTEDLEDGLVYRFIPHSPGRLLDGGRLQALGLRERPGADLRNWVDDGGRPQYPLISTAAPLAVRWVDIGEVSSPNNDLRHVGFAAGAARFARAEGMWAGDGVIYFACTNGGPIKQGQIWKYRPSAHEGTPAEEAAPGRLELFIESRIPGIIENADNLTISPSGDLVVCEDGPGEQNLVHVTPAGEVHPLARNALDRSEFAGAVFSPDGSTLFVNMQTTGLTLAITGPWTAHG